MVAAAHDRHLGSDAHRVQLAFALLWTYRPRSAVYAVLMHLGLRRTDGRMFAQEDVRAIIRDLRDQGALHMLPQREGFYRLADHGRAQVYRELLDGIPAETLRRALHQLERFPEHLPYAQWYPQDAAPAVALIRLELFSGTSAANLERLRRTIRSYTSWEELLWNAAIPGFDPVLFDRITSEQRWSIAAMACAEFLTRWARDVAPLVDWLLPKLATHGHELPTNLRLCLAEILLHRGDLPGVRDAIAQLDSPGGDALGAALLACESRWPEAITAWEAALKRAQTDSRAVTGARAAIAPHPVRRKNVFPATAAWLYPLALLAHGSRQHLERARKFCAREAGQRDPSPHGWGLWVHAIDVRLGDAALLPDAFNFISFPQPAHAFENLWKLLLAAWLGREVLGLARKPALEPHVSGFATTLRNALTPCSLTRLLHEVEAAEAVLLDRDPPHGFFVPARREQWRDVLAALEALGTDPAEADADPQATRIVWSLTLGPRGEIYDVEPLEQKHGARGWGKPKAISLARVLTNKRLAPHDAKVAATIRKDRYLAREVEIDRAAAAVALVGHPAVAFADAPSQFVELVDAMPELEVIAEKGSYRLRVTPSFARVPSASGRARGSVTGDSSSGIGDAPPIIDDPSAPGDADTSDPDDHAAVDDRDTDHPTSTGSQFTVAVIRDSAQRARVIRFTEAQRRAARLLAGRFSVPLNATDELQTALRALARHFQVHSDHAQAAREVPCESRLRAELSPSGDELTVRLIATPLGPDGPRVTPGSGRERLIANVRGETIGTRRDLAAERAHLQAVREALPFLDRASADQCEWRLQDPEEALATVEALPQLAAVAGIDWPKGKRVRVLTVDTPQLRLSLRSAQDWFQVTGGAKVDESTVLELEQLLQAARSRSRFVAIGDGTYAALTRTLKQRLADLAAVTEAHGDGVRAPFIAAAWLDDTLADTTVETDARFRTAIDRLREAQAQSPAVPNTLQTTLRSYQEDGFRWAMRLAHAGLGGCLADDMGLGKTLQALAVLLSRAEGGPALVIAPTSVCGNWIAEATRFAPTLDVHLYGETERESIVANAGANDVIVISYTLLQQARARFGARGWHTVIADEAQAIKNAAAKRSLAVFDLEAGFRLALSGTPVENRLAELWSIMRFVNPGLLGSLARFNERFAIPIERDRDRDAQHVLRRVIAPFVLRRTKAQVLQELPPRTELVIKVAAEPLEAAHYEALRRDAMANADRLLATASAGEARINILAQLMRLRRAACDPRLVTPEFDMPGAKVRAFADLALHLVENGHKALVFSQFVDFLTVLRAPLDEAGIAYQYLDGSTPAPERTRRVAAFQRGEGDLFLVSLKAGGFGLNLTAADYVLITDPWWNPAAEDQATGRAHRIGQSRPVTVYRLVMAGTVEERIVGLHDEKRALAESILDQGDVAALPSAEDLISLMRG